MEAALTFRAHKPLLDPDFSPPTNSPTVQVNENSAVHNSGQRKIRQSINKDHFLSVLSSSLN